MKANPTDAKDIAVAFLKQIGKEHSNSAYAKNVRLAKQLLTKGYHKEQILEVIEVAFKKNPGIYSFGFILVAIDDILEEIKLDKKREEGKTLRQEQEEELIQRRKVVSDVGESAKRNEQKSGRFGFQRRLGEKFDFDMFR